MTMGAVKGKMPKEMLGERLAEHVAHHLRLSPECGGPNTGLKPVDVARTNESLVLGGVSLCQFSALTPGSAPVLRLGDMAMAHAPLAPEKLNVVLLAGGMSFRTDGKVHPLLQMEDPRTRETRTLIDWQCRRLGHSCLARAKVFIVANLFTEAALKEELNRWAAERRLYAGGLAPLLEPEQNGSGELRLCRDSRGERLFNPAGHFEALRWLVISGCLGEMAEDSVVLIASYSNWGSIHTEGTLSLAKHVAELGGASEHFPVLGEVSQISVQDGQPGSFLTMQDGNISVLRLVKYNYGRGRFGMGAGRTIFMSTNSLYFSVGSLLARLRKAALSLETEGLDGNLNKMLCAARLGQKRLELSAVVDRAFPVPPQLIATQKGGVVEPLRIERDLDQITLLPDVLYRAVEVGAERAVFLKLPSDFDDPGKRTLVFGGNR